MKIRYIALDLYDLLDGYYDYYNCLNGSRFLWNRFFITHYLSKAIRKCKIETNGFNMFLINLNPKDLCIRYNVYDRSDTVLRTYMPFTKEDLWKFSSLTKQEDRYEYYLELLENGYMYALSQGYEFGQDKLLELHHKFREGGYKNEWLWKKKLFRDKDMYVFFKCALTTFKFTLTLEVYNAKQTQCLLKEVIFRTAPDSLLYDKDIRNLVIDDGKMTITDFLCHPLLSIDINDLSRAVLTIDGHGHQLKCNTELIERITW